MQFRHRKVEMVEFSEKIIARLKISSASIDELHLDCYPEMCRKTFRNRINGMRTAKSIASLHRTSRSVQYCLPTTTKNKLIKCLGCGRDFETEGKHNRICKRCKESPIYGGSSF